MQLHTEHIQVPPSLVRFCTSHTQTSDKRPLACSNVTRSTFPDAMYTGLYESANRAELHTEKLTNNPRKNRSGITKPFVAICITGQRSRLWPHSLVDNLVDANPLYTFDLFVALGPGQALTYNTHLLPPRDNTLKDMIHHVSPLARLNDDELLLVLQRYGSGNHQVHILERTHIRNTDEWKHELNTSKLDAIHMYTSTQDGILNTYMHHASCARAIEAHEDKHSKRFDYIISTRDDIYLLGPVNLQDLFAKSSPTCDIYTKGCMNWGGMNNRFHVMRRERGLAFLASRLDFYRIVLHERTAHTHSTKNPERFELMMTRWLGMNVCNCPWDARSTRTWNSTTNTMTRCLTELPVVAARYSSKGKACFMPKELASYARAGGKCYLYSDPVHMLACGSGT
jgi:hypothetical protein